MSPAQGAASCPYETFKPATEGGVPTRLGDIGVEEAAHTHEENTATQTVQDRETAATTARSSGF